MYLHNAVEGHPEMSKSQFLENLKKVFEFYEEKRKASDSFQQVTGIHWLL